MSLRKSAGLAAPVERPDRENRLMFTRSQVEESNLNHFDALIAACDKAMKSKQTFAEHVQTVESGDWRGKANDAAVDTAEDAQRVVNARCNIYSDLKAIAQRGRDDVGASKGKLLSSVGDTESDGYRVGETWHPTETRPYNKATSLARGALLVEHARTIQQNLWAFQDTDARVSKEITNKAAELDNLKIRRPNDARGVVQPADYRTGPPTDPPTDPSGMTKPQALAAWDQVNDDIVNYNARCGRTFGAGEEGKYAACVADMSKIGQRQDAIKARLEQLGEKNFVQVQNTPVKPADGGGGVPHDTFNPNKGGSYTSKDPYHPGMSPPSTPAETYKTSSDGNGWKYIDGTKSSGMDYQEQISGATRTPNGLSPEWMQNGTKFDGHEIRTLPGGGTQEVFLEAKDGYSKVATQPGMPWTNGMVQSTVDQIPRELAAMPKGSVLEIHCSDPVGTAALRQALDDADIHGPVVVIYTPKTP